MKNISWFIILSGFVLLASCRKESGGIPSGSYTKNYMSARIDGVQYTFSSLDSERLQGSMMIWGADPGISIGVGGPENSFPGLYDVSTSPDYGALVMINGDLYIAERGSIRLSGFSGRYEGTFDFMARSWAIPNDTIRVTEGRFGYTP